MGIVKLSSNHDSADEVAGLMEETGGGRMRKPIASATKSSASPVIKTVMFMLLGLGVLVATDFIEIKGIRRKGSNVRNSDGDDGPFIHGSVVLKHNGTMAKDGEEVGGKPAATEPVDYSKLSRHTYRRRGQPLSDEAHQALETEWGRWSWDDEPQRPVQDALYEKYPNRDVPTDAWPEGAWQRDRAYLERYLTESLALVERAQEAILAEYGHGVKNHPGDDKSFEARSEQFKVNIGSATIDGGGSGGYFSEKSWAGLKRRLLHAMMTEDSFNFAMGGHSASAGHGNHFSQSYTLQVAWIMEPVFARLGVKHESRNFGNGGMGTAHNGIAAGSIYGPDVSLLMWDSGMTEREKHLIDMFARQGLIGGKKVPVLLSVPGSATIAEFSGADIGNVGSGMGTVPGKNTLEDVQKANWATKFLNCQGQLQKDVCRPNEYNGTCWVERPDYHPKGQGTVPGSRASWHPGNRHHQIKGRAISFMLLTAMKEVLTEWKASENFVVADDLWHVTSMYESVREKIMTGPTGECGGMSKFGLEFLCTTPMQARSNFSPRAYPELSSIRNVMPEAMKVLLPPPQFNVSSYSPPDVFIPAIHPPPGEVDVLSIVESGPEFRPIVKPDYTDVYAPVTNPMEPKVVPGKGVGDTDPPGRCDGTLDSWCKRVEQSNNCLLAGHNDDRSGLQFDGYSGWIVMQLPRVKHGRVVVKFHSWHSPKSNSRTDGFIGINNEAEPDAGAVRGLRDAEESAETMSIEDRGELDFPSHRKLKVKPADFCEGFKFEYAIDGKITSLSLEEYREKHMLVQRVVETVTIMDDPAYTGGKEQDVEVAVRITGCARSKVFLLTHVYWA